MALSVKILFYCEKECFLDFFTGKLLLAYGNVTAFE